MTSLSAGRMPHRFTTLFGLLVLVYFCLGNRVLSADTPSEDVVAIRRVQQATMEMQVAIIQAKTAEEKELLNSDLDAKRKQLPRELLELAEKYPATRGGLAALYWATFLPTDHQSSRAASQRFCAQAVSSKLDDLSAAIKIGRQGIQESGKHPEIAKVLLKRVHKNPDDESAPVLLTCVCRLSNTSEAAMTSNPMFEAAADLIVKYHADSPGITNFCELLGRGTGSPRWAVAFEPHLRTILKKNQNRHVRCVAAFALASVVERSTEDRHQEAGKLYREFLDNFDGQHDYHFQGIEQRLRQNADDSLEVLSLIGRPALETIGEDLNGERISLSDYQGKVVLLSCWASWCTPCIEMIPHERAIARRFEGKDFALIGVNSDTDLDAAKKLVETQNITWKSFQDHHDRKDLISEQWKVSTWPTTYLLDKGGVVRKCWKGDVSAEELSDIITKLADPTTASSIE